MAKKPGYIVDFAAIYHAFTQIESLESAASCPAPYTHFYFVDNDCAFCDTAGHGRANKTLRAYFYALLDPAP
jgi:hypothetical protein